MSDEESSYQEYYIDPSREESVRQEVLDHLDILNEKTINFEDLLNELVRHGCLSFEEKFKILSGIVDENTSNKTLGEKCNELYQTLLIKKKISLSKLLQGWEFTGNSYLVGRFDTHFNVEGRDSKSLKFHKLKALPSHRTEFLTHLHLKQLTLSPKALLKCLRKSSRLVSIRLERIKVPFGGRSSDDPSSDFDQPLILPNLKEFYFEEVSKTEPFKTVKDVNFFLDELNLKPMLFFGLNSNMAWDAGIRIEVKMRGAVLVRMDPAGGQFTSMLRRRTVEYGGFINPTEAERVSLYECYLPKAPFFPNLRHLVIYRCKVSNFDQLLASCPNLFEIALYGEAENNNIAQIDLNCFAASKSSLTRLTLGYTSLFFSNYWDKDLELGLHLETLCLDTCNIKLQSPDYPKVFGKIDKLALISTSVQVLHDFAVGVKAGEIWVADFSWEEAKQPVKNVDEESLEGEEKGLKESEGNEINHHYKEMVSFLSKDLKQGKDDCFSLEWIQDSAEEEDMDDKQGLKDKWKVKKVKATPDPGKVTFESASFSDFVEESGRKSWFDLPFKSSGESDGDPRKSFRASHGF